jgi:hypothetical protein
VALDASPSAGASFGGQAIAWGLGSVCSLAVGVAAGPTLGVSAVVGAFVCGAGAFGLAALAEDIANNPPDLADLAGFVDPAAGVLVGAVLDQMAQDQEQGPDPGTTMPSPVETVPIPVHEIGDQDDSDGDGDASPGGPADDGDPAHEQD